MSKHLLAFASCLALAFPAIAQTEAPAERKADLPTEKIWRMETSGIGG
jgi:hypothetical protein